MPFWSWYDLSTYSKRIGIFHGKWVFGGGRINVLVVLVVLSEHTSTWVWLEIEELGSKPQVFVFSDKRSFWRHFRLYLESS